MRFIPPWQFTTQGTIMAVGSMLAVIVAMTGSVEINRPHLGPVFMIGWGWFLCRYYDRFVVPIIDREAEGGA